MSLATVIKPILPLYPEAAANAPLADEVLCGMTVEILEEAGERCRVRTRYRYEGWVPAEGLARAGAAEWEAYGKLVARAPFVDVMAAPDANSAILFTLPRGGLLHPTGAEDEDAWLPVGLPGGEAGYVKGANLMPHNTGWKQQEEKSLREALAATAMSYLGTQYRHGGKTPAGIDCSGLVSMAYLLNGATVWRNAQHRDGYDTHEIPREALGMGDIIYFDGHAAMYLGDGMFIHATAKAGSDGVVLNSLRPDSPFYREDLDKKLTGCASLF